MRNSRGVAIASLPVRFTPGMGLRFITPVGPIRVDAAYNPYDTQVGPLYLVDTNDNLVRRGDFPRPGMATGRSFWDRIQIHVNSFGGHFVNSEDERRCDMASPASLEAMEWLRARMWDDRVMPTFLDVQNMETREAFIAQKIAMVEDGSWALKDILENGSFRVGVAPFPAGPERAGK